MNNKEKPPYSIGQNLCFMMKIAWQIRKRVPFICGLAALISALLNLVQLYMAPEILAQVEQHSSLPNLLLTISGFTAGLIFLSGMEGYLNSSRLPAESDVRKEIMGMITRKTCTTSYPNLQDPKVLKLKEQADEAVGGNSDAGEHIWRTLSQLLSNGLSFVGCLAVFRNLHPFLILVILFTSSICFFVTRHVNEWEYRHREEKESCEKEISYFNQLAQALDFAKDLRVFGLDSWLRDLQGRALKACSVFINRREKIHFWGDGADVMLALVGNGVAYGFLIHQALTNGLSASQFLLYCTGLNRFASWITGLLNSFSQLHRESIALSRIQEYLNIQEQFLFSEGEKPSRAETYSLTLEDVTFRYPGTEKNILEHVNLTIHPGERLAVVGLNGAGKTTLVKLLCGFYDPTEGRVLLNGQDVKTLDRSAYYALFSAVFQHFSILDTTIAEAVAQTGQDPDLPRVYDCLEKAGLGRAVSKLPQGVNTHIGREVYLDGVCLSGGQTQRLMLARALYKNGPILILDEPTSALDPLAESDIYRKYSAMTEGKTSLFVSHRLASTRFCHRILLVAKGGIQEEGTHEELLAKGGAYAGLYEVQSRYYREKGEAYEEAQGNFS